jgi:uncharacterized protein (TIGR02301 family)
MSIPASRLLRLGLGASVLAAALMFYAPVASAQFFLPWFDDQPRARPKPRPKPAPAPGDDLPPIVVKPESSAPPQQDDRPYDPKLLRLAEILGAVHYLRELCGAQEGQLWREQMKDILRYEGTTAVRRAKLVNSFNDGYRGYRRTYRTCTSSAALAITRFSTEGAQIAAALAHPSHVAARTPQNDESQAQDNKAQNNKPQQGNQGKTDANKTGALPNDQTKSAQGKPGKKAATPQANADQAQQGTQTAHGKKASRQQGPPEGF